MGVGRILQRKKRRCGKHNYKRSATIILILPVMMIAMPDHLWNLRNNSKSSQGRQMHKCYQ